MKKVITMAVLAAVVLTGCAAQSPAERAARHYAYAMPESLNGNYQTDRNGTAKLMTPIFQRVYDEGVKLKAAGGTLAQANQVAEQVRNAAAHSTTRMDYSNNVTSEGWQKEHTKKQNEDYGRAMAAVFLDGFNGVK